MRPAAWLAVNRCMFSASNSASHSTSAPDVLLVTGTSWSARAMSFCPFISTPRSNARVVQPAGVRHTSFRLAEPLRTSCVRPAMKMGAVATRLLVDVPSSRTVSLNTPVGSTA